MDDLPVLKKCCFCVPLRYGLLTWGYIKLGIALLVFSFYIILLVAVGHFIQAANIIALIGMLLATEIIIHIVFIIGAHKKKVKLLKVYYYYAIFMWVTIILVSVVSLVFLALAMWDRRSDSTVTTVLISASFSIIISIVVQTFLLLSIRSEIIKLRSNCPYRFVKDDNEPEGTLNSVKDEEEKAIDNGAVRIL